MVKKKKKRAARAVSTGPRAKSTLDRERFRSLMRMSSDLYWETDTEHRLSELVYGAGRRPGANHRRTRRTAQPCRRLAVADARVVSVVNDQPLQVPGALPENLSIAQEDGNNVVLDLGDGRFALCAHMQPGSVRVKKGDKVRRGEVLGLVGNSGNTSAPHVHFHVMDGPSPLASNGVPYLMDRFSVSEQGVSTQAFRTAESMGTPLEVEPVQYPGTHRDELPLDLSIATFR